MSEIRSLELPRLRSPVDFELAVEPVEPGLPEELLLLALRLPAELAPAAEPP